MINLVIVLFVLLAGLSAWEEVQQLVQRGSWKREDYRYPEWTTKRDSIWKNFDSHHFAFGAFVLVMFSLMSLVKLEWWMIPIAWYLFFHLRNIFMHIVFKRKPIWAYLYKL